MQLSIIIPVYNVAATLRKCVDSITCQFAADWELILVDDGSTDESSEMVDALAAEYEYIRAFHKENGGLSDARNYGIVRAKGDYLTFVDSDDVLAPDTLLPLMRILNEHPECDVLEYQALVHAHHESECLLQLPDYQWHSARQYWHDTKGWEHTYAWNKLYKRQLFNKIMFKKGCIFEDAWFWPELLSLHPCVFTTSRGLYLYVWNMDGITVNATTHDLWQLFCSQLRGAYLMRTSPFSSNGRLLYRSMCCRLYDIIRFTFLPRKR